MIDFEVEVEGLDDLRKATVAMQKLARELSGPFQKAAAKAIADHVAMRARENAPVDKDELRPAIQASEASLKGNVATATVSVPDSVEHAAIMHQHLLGPGGATQTSEGLAFGQPLQSRFTGITIFNLDMTLVRLSSVSTTEGGVGGRFITRVAEYHKQQYENQIAATLNSVLSKRRRGTFKFTS